DLMLQLMSIGSESITSISNANLRNFILTSLLSSPTVYRLYNIVKGLKNHGKDRVKNLHDDYGKRDGKYVICFERVAESYSRNRHPKFVNWYLKLSYEFN